VHLDMTSHRAIARQANYDDPASGKFRYTAPGGSQIALGELLAYAGRSISTEQEGLFKKPEERDPIIFYAGDVSLVRKPSISVIGARGASDEGLARAERIARELARAGVVVTSGLAKGIDASAHTAAIAAGGRTVAVIGTPLEKAYPAENARLQQVIYQDHLLISQFHPGQRTYPSDFPKRNRLMAALSDGSVIVEASDTSGTLHQAAECARLGRWLFIMKSVVENEELSWPQRFLGHPKTVILASAEDILSRI
jgi:DNA processing protein